MAMPAQKPGRSVQDYQTPENFLAAVKYKLGIIDFAIDLAADEHNTAADRWWDESQDSLQQSWQWPGWAWLNPPFKHIEPWVEKAWRECCAGAHIALLVPAGVGSNWWKRHVHEKAHVLLLNGRITFVGQPTCYPKDTCLLLYEPSEPSCWYSVWTWPLSAATRSGGSTPAAARPE